MQAIPGLVHLLQLAPTPPALALGVMAVTITLLVMAARTSWSPALKADADFLYPTEERL